VRYGGACLYVVAADVDAARALLRSGPVGIASYGSTPGPNDYDIVTEAVITREPDRVLDVPCAEMYHWEE
jgi:hypothetical protein